MKTKIKNCAVCGVEIEVSHGNRKLCRNCAEIRIKESYEKSKQKRKALNSYKIHGNSICLSRDVHEAIKRGISYGKYMAMKNDPIARRENCIL